MQDIRRISMWKRDGIKDGRALLRWALSFVDRSALPGQMQVVKDLHAAKLTARATLFDLEEHLSATWELWLALTNSDRALPADYFRILLMSMPTEPESPVVCLRRWLVDLIERGDSPLLLDIDSDNGLFAKMRSYGASLGIKDVAPDTLQVFRAGASSGGGQNEFNSNSTQSCCNAYACPDKKNTPDGFCVCDARSSVSLNSISNKGRREYVKLMRSYSAANPGKPLKVDIQLVKKKMGKSNDSSADKSTSGSSSSAAAAPAASQQPAVNYMASVQSVLGSEITDKAALDDWLAKHNDTDGFYVMGDMSGDGELNFAVVETPAAGPSGSASARYGDTLDSSSSSRCSARSSSEAEFEIARLKSELEVSQLKNKQLEAASAATPATQPVQAPATPAQTPETLPNPALDRPSPFFANVTPKELYTRWEQSPARARLMSAGSRFRTPARPESIKEEPSDASAGGANNATSAEHFARGIVAAEKEKRKIKNAVDRKITLGSLARSLLRLCSWNLSMLKHLSSVAADYAGDLSLHQLLTLTLLGHALSSYVRPVARVLLAKTADFVLTPGVVKLKTLVASTLASLTSATVAAMSRSLASVASKLRSAPTAQARAPYSAHTPAAPGVVGRSWFQSAAAAAPAVPAVDMVLMPLVNERLGDSVLMATHNMSLSDNLRPALMDNGASKGTSCSRTLDGAIPGTHKPEDAGSIGLGSDGATLESLGSHLYALERHGMDSSEIVLRRLKHTPNLPMAMVFSEATENIQYGYGIFWHPGSPREMHSPDGTAIKLFMSTSELGWLKVRPITNGSEVARLLCSSVPKSPGACNQSSLQAMNPALVRTVGMGSFGKLKGVALLRRRHCTDGHVALPVTVKNLRLEGAFDDGRLTLADVELFAKEGCGACELAKMRRRAFSIKVEQDDPTPPALGKFWTFDVLELRVPCAHTGAPFYYVAVEKISKLCLGARMHGYTEDNVTSSLNDLKARVRPTHGEVYILRMDSHPSHRSRHVRDYALVEQNRLQLSPPYVHEGVGDAEVILLHNVPSANAMLAASLDLGESHFAQALSYVLVARNHSVTSSSSPPRSPCMIYYGSDKYLPSHLMVFAAEGKALVHGEARESKFDDHAKPCIYVGPAIDSDSRAHCAVWHGNRYVDVDVGCIAVNETTIIDRTRRDHPCTQPFNQVAGAKTVNVGKPTAIFDLVGTTCDVDQLPAVQPIVWVRSMEPPSDRFALLVWHGELRPGDLAAWTYELSVQKVIPLPIDLSVGGQEHNTSRGVVKKDLVAFAEHDNCAGIFMAPKCSRFSASRYNQPGPPVLFDLDHPDGIPDEDGELDPEVLIALAEIALVVQLFRTARDTDKVVMLEFPASQGKLSPYSAKGREKHSTIADTSLMRALIDEMQLELVYTEQGAAGAETRKPTCILATPNAAHALRRTVGTLRVPDRQVQTTSLLGQAEDGSYNTKASERYSAHFAMLVTIAFVGSMPSVFKPNGEAVDPPATEPATDDIYPVGTRVEVWWFVEKQWFGGTVIDSKVRKGKVHGRLIPRREVKVRYDSDDQQLWHTLCDNSIREMANEENDATIAVLQLLVDRGETTSSAVGDPPPSLHLATDLSPCSVSADELAQRVASYCMALRRACTSFALELDEATACNGETRAEEHRNALIKLVGDEASADTLIDSEFDKLRSKYTDEEWRTMAIERKSWLASCAPSPRALPPSASLSDRAGEMFVLRQVQLDLEDGALVDPLRVIAVLDDSTAVDVDYSEAHGWHVPRNEREYQISPQRDLWRTAKELKMDKYHAVDMFELVPKSSVDTSKHTIYDTLWVYKIKWKDGGLVFDKLNPRWCVKGGTMDRDLFKCYAEMMRETSMGIMFGLKASFFDLLADALFDLSDAFQATSTVSKTGELLPGQQEFYTRQAPGFVKFGPQGEELVCRQKCYMQGRIDATAGFDRRITGIITKSAHFKALLWDPKVFLYHNTKYMGTAEPLDSILRESRAIVDEGRDSPPQQPPMGWALMGQHVDDMQALASGAQSIDDNRLLAFIKGEIATTYACTLTGWHGKKLLGFDLQLNPALRTVYVYAQATYDALRAKLLTDDTVKVSPKHIVSEGVYESCPGDAPPVGDPERPAFLQRQALIRSALGGGIWLSRAYPQLTSGINAMCVNMANPGDARLAQLRHMFMYLGANPQGKTFGGESTSPVSCTPRRKSSRSLRA